MKTETYIPSWAVLPKEKFCLSTYNSSTDSFEVKAEISSKPGFILGRSPDCDIVCTEESVSRIHALIAHSQEGVTFVTDLNSKHGNFHFYY